MLCLYHGTGENAAKKILSTKILAAEDVPLTYPDDKPMGTESGFLYLSDKLFVAVDYATLNESDIPKEERTCYVFKVLIDPSVITLEADRQDLRQFYKEFDENTHYTYLESLEYCGSARTSHDLRLGHEVVAYFEFKTGPMKSTSELSAKARNKVRNFPTDDFDPSQFIWIPL